MKANKIPWPVWLVVLALSLAMRLFAVDAFLGGDESKWLCRSINFHSALTRGALAETYQSEHPGVVTMWLGTLAISLEDAGPWVEFCGLYGGDKLTRADAQMLAQADDLIFRGRWLVALATWLGIVGMALLLRRLLDERAALLAAVLVALDPFYLALSRVLHLDALLTTFMTLSVLALLVYRLRGEQLRYLIVSAVAGGLAVANKSPGMFLLPWVAMVMGLCAWRGEAAGRGARVWRAAKRTALWAAILGGVVCLTWPSLWVDPLGTLRNVTSAAIGYAEEAHGNSNFFWFAERPDPGAAFYPVAWAFRTTPLVLAGLAMAAAWRRRTASEAALWLLSFALLYTAFMTLGAKKFDRYGLPAYPALDILAGMGWAALLARPRAAARPARFAAQWAGPLLALGLLGGQFGLAWARQPYYLSYYNPLLGGTAVAPHILLVGWGEGLEKAAEYLNAKPGAEDMQVNTAHIAQFAPFFKGHTSSTGDVDLAEADYYVFYINVVQRARDADVLDRFYGVQEPEHIVQVDGIDYVYIYANTLYQPAVDYLEVHADAQEDVVILDVNAALLRHYGGDLRIVHVDATRDAAIVQETLEAATAGCRRAWFLTFDETPGDPEGRIAGYLDGAGQAADAQSWEGMKLTAYDLDANALTATDLTWEGGVGLAGCELGGTALVRGDPAEVTLYWRCPPGESGYTAFVHLIGPDGRLYGVAEAPLDSAQVQEIGAARCALVLTVLPDAPEGDYRLAVGVYRSEDGTRPALLGADQEAPGGGAWLPAELSLALP